MIHLTKSKTGYMVVTIADNGEVLATSEILKTKRSAWGNIDAQACEFGYANFLVQDDTNKPKPVLYSMAFLQKPKKIKYKPGKKYIPGKNPKKISPAKTRKH